MSTLKPSTKFPIVGIGTSAGGLEALEQFFGNMPAVPDMAFVVIQHLDPNHEGILPDLLQRVTSLKVVEVTDKLKTKLNHIYVIPRNKSMSILNGNLHLFEPVESRGLRLPIDVFFRSLAVDQKENSIGVILSGMGSDGTLGLKAIKEQGGVVVVQDPQTAKFSAMPLSAKESVISDIVAPAEELPDKLLAFIRKIPAINSNLLDDDKNYNNLEKIDILLRTHTGNDFSLYKKNVKYRRIERRMNVHHLDKIAKYVRFLQENPNEIEILFNELLIGVTNFFRDPLLWEKLKEQILPNLINELPDGHIVRVWVAACSTGEEAYSFAMIFKEVCEKMNPVRNITLQIFATDLDTDAIEAARRGIYSAHISSDVSQERLSKFFTKIDTKYSINNSLREMVVFASHNLIKDPPFTKLDFLLCRNLLIYLDNELQNKLMNLFYYSLNEGKFLILGTAENANSTAKLFTAIESKLKIFRRSISAQEVDKLDFPNSFARRISKIKDNYAERKTDNLQNFAEQFLLQSFIPASALINPEGDILYITGKIGKYLEPAAGKANMNIYSMAREGLRNGLLSSIRKVRQTEEQFILKNIRTGSDDNQNYVDVILHPVKKPEAFKGTIMLIFSDAKDAQKIAKKSKKSRQSGSTYSNEMELELEQARSELQTTTEEMQTSQEELISINEELQSANEELQSTNEELITSKEEMQSLNEELQTVNGELQNKVYDYIEANNDMKNLFNSTDSATLFLDKDLNIRRYTDQLTKLIKLRATDIGRPFTEIVSDLYYPEIAQDSRKVLQTLEFSENDVSTIDNRWYRVKIMPYRTLDEKIDGLVLTFIDVTQTKIMERELKDKIEIIRKHNLYNEKADN